MENWSYTEELRSHLGRHPQQRGRSVSHDRDVARMLAPWRRGTRRGGPDPVARLG
jgi:hypothetical protein